MGTRGAVGWIAGGRAVAHYRHLDSYPTEGGKAFAADVIAMTDRWLYWRRRAEGAMSVKDSAKITEVETSCFGVASSWLGQEWYEVMHQHQGSIKRHIEFGPRGVALDNIEFLKDSMSCEWGYLLHFEKALALVFKGANKVQKDEAPYDFCRSPYGYQCSYSGNTFWGCRLLCAVPVDLIKQPDDLVEFIREVMTASGEGADFC